MVAPLSLEHELAHAEGYDYDQDAFFNRKITFDATFENAEEKRVITQIETPVAIQLGEGVRTDHSDAWLPYVWSVGDLW